MHSGIRTHNRTADRRLAFSLVELLVVIAVIAMLMAILMPALGRVRGSAVRVVCRSRLHNAGAALRMYVNEHAETMPNAAQVPSEEPDRPCITDVLLPYIDTPDLMHCPADKEFFQKEGTSYEYPHFVRGMRVDDTFLGKRWGEANIPVLFDFGPFHNRPGKRGAMNFLFADGHVGELGRPAQ